MISVIYCTKEHKPNHIEHIKKTSGIGKFIDVIEIINNGESLTKAYNRGLKQAKFDIVVYLHDDETIESSNWANKLIKHYKSNPEYGIIGVAGTKYMVETGKWWEDMKKMYGRVAHTHDGRTWLSEYSRDIGNDIEDVIIVDGVFFSLHKKRIKYDFDERFEGFHFYDVSFCFRNYINGVKVGVITNIRINHQSIGQTNEQWEQNRIQFAELYEEQLPVKIKKVFKKNEKIKVLIACLSFKNLTGSELYVYELAKELIKNGCDVSICSDIGEPLKNMVNRLGIKTYTLMEPPGFKAGDGKFQVQTPQGLQLSQEKTLYKIGDVKFDVLHVNHTPIAEHILRLYPSIPTIMSNHSEIISLENPVINEQIKKYIAIRPEIKDYLINNFNIPEDKITVIYNPIDYNRFKPTINTEKRDKKRILFVGTIDYIRKNTIQDLINTTEENNEELWIVGAKNDVYLDNMIKDKQHVKYFPPTLNVEKYINQCDTVAGIKLGRTTIEGWLCGKSAWIYDVDNMGNIQSKSLHQPPYDIDKFRSDNVAKQIIEEYKEVIE